MFDITEKNFKTINTLATRLVENQQRSASFELVDDDPAMHDVLEDILEQSKPALPRELNKRHYLIKTPFRYPPLEYGSRFGRTHEPGIFYASLSIDCLLAEVAFYRFVFLDDMEVPFKDGLSTEHTAFDIRVKTERALFLDEPPFDQHREALRDKENYSACQMLGSEAREINTDVLRYYSARSEEPLRNIAVLDHKAIKGNPKTLKSIRCKVNHNKCTFTHLANNERHQFLRTDFEIDGKLPRPSV